MCANEFNEHAFELIRDTNNEPIPVSGNVEYDTIIADEIDGRAELILNVLRRLPFRPPGQSMPRPQWPLGPSVLLPEDFQGTFGNDLHGPV
jgi:hypothetical protein